MTESKESAHGSINTLSNSLTLASQTITETGIGNRQVSEDSSRLVTSARAFAMAWQVVQTAMISDQQLKDGIGC